MVGGEAASEVLPLPPLPLLLSMFILEFIAAAAVWAKISIISFDKAPTDCAGGSTDDEGGELMRSMLPERVALGGRPCMGLLLPPLALAPPISPTPAFRMAFRTEAWLRGGHGTPLGPAKTILDRFSCSSRSAIPIFKRNCCCCCWLCRACACCSCC